MNSVFRREWSFEGLSLIGNSTAGVATSLSCPELGVVFDVGPGLPWAFGSSHYLITHAHMDHAAGIPYLISIKALMGQKAPKFFMPPYMLEPLTKIMESWRDLENHEYDYEFHPLEAGVSIPLKGNYCFQAFPTVHRVPSQGYCVFEKKKKLKSEFRLKKGQEIAQMKSQGISVEDFVEEPILAFTGDTQIDFLEGPEFIRKAKILVMEVTYIDDSKSVENARTWGHVHWLELKEKLSLLENQKVVLMHLSARHKTKEFQKIIQEQVSEAWQKRLVVFPRDGQ